MFFLSLSLVVRASIENSTMLFFSLSPRCQKQRAPAPTPTDTALLRSGTMHEGCRVGTWPSNCDRSDRRGERKKLLKRRRRRRRRRRKNIEVRVRIYLSFCLHLKFSKRETRKKYHFSVCCPLLSLDLPLLSNTPSPKKKEKKKKKSQLRINLENRYTEKKRKNERKEEWSLGQKKSRGCARKRKSDCVDPRPFFPPSLFLSFSIFFSKK